MLRERIRKGRTVEYFVPDAVNKILTDKGHYRATATSISACASPSIDALLPPGSGADLSSILKK
jgi:hypothetical protein